MSEETESNSDTSDEQVWNLDYGDEDDNEFDFEFLNGHTMTFRVQEPETETISSFVMPAPDSDKTVSERQFEFVRKAVIEPEVTIDKWRDMKNVDQSRLTARVSDTLGVDRLMDFTDASAAPRQQESLGE